MKKSEIAASVFGKLDSAVATPLGGGPLSIPVRVLAGLAMVPWFCDASVQWAIRISQPGVILKKALLKKVNDSFITATDAGAVLIGVPGDGIAAEHVHARSTR